MDDPLARMGTPKGASGSPSQSGAGGTLSAPRGTPVQSPASGAPRPEPAEASGGLGGTHEERPAGGGGEPDYESWVREKVLFLMHPERWLGTRGDAKWDEVAGEGALPETGGDDRDPRPDCACPRCPRERRLPGRRGAPAAARPRGPAFPPRPVLVRVVDSQVTQEVLRTAWGQGSVTRRTEERSVTAVTFRTSQE